MDTPNNYKKKSIVDNLFLGVVIGLFVPLMAVPLVAYIRLYHSPKNMSMEQFFNFVFHSKDLAASLLSLSVLFNLGVFFIFYRLKYDDANKGLIAASVIFFIIVSILKLT